jgi:hypothetical protein
VTKVRNYTISLKLYLFYENGRALPNKLFSRTLGQGACVVAIFYMDVKIIGRSSGRSSVGAAAYRRSAKMQSVAHAAYQRGEKIIGVGDKITHDYRSKGGVVHSEIMLPKDAPPEFMDAQTLWKAVETSETRKNAQLAREIIVALPKEFNLNEQVEVLRAYLRENFVRIGMIADFSVHDKGEGNPHAHIMLTMREVSKDGFGKKNRDWNKKENLLQWRKAWAHTNNDMFERKGLAERIDHRTYKEQSLDRKATIHMGRAATALERQGIKTERGNYNREVQQHNDFKDLHATLMRANETVRQYLKDEKTAQNEEKTDVSFASLKCEKATLKIECDCYEREIFKLKFCSEDADERVKSIERLQDKGEEMAAERQKMHFWQILRKRDMDWEIRKLERKIRDAQRNFEIEHNIAYDKAPAEIERIKKELSLKRSGLEQKKSRIAEIDEMFEAINPYSRIPYTALEAYGYSMYDTSWRNRRRQPPKPRFNVNDEIDKLVQLGRQLDADAIPEDEFAKIIAGFDALQKKLNRTKRRSMSR